MPEFRIHRMKEHARQQFRWAPHTGGITSVKPKDYEAGAAYSAATAYALWAELKDSPEALQVGDILEVEGGDLSIYKFVGFEPARWVVPEPKAGSVPAAGGEVVSPSSAERA